MKHYMHLNNNQFNKMKRGIKTIELRLNDEKRRLLNINDDIEITNLETLEKIVGGYRRITSISKF